MKKSLKEKIFSSDGLLVSYLIIASILIFHFWDRNEVPPQSQEFRNCLNIVKNEYISFWSNYKNDKTDGISLSPIENLQKRMRPLEEFESSHQKAKEDCYKNYHSYFTTQNDQLHKIGITYLDIDKYYTPESERYFETLPIDLKIKYAPRLFPKP